MTSVDAGVRVRPARPDEGERLRAIAESAKGHWGYGAERVRAWAAEGDFSAEGLRSKKVYVAEVDGRAVAWAALVPRGEVVWLDDMWVDPPWMGKGLGTALFHHCAETAATLGGRTMEWEAEPNAVVFYERMGARHLQDGELSAWGRVLPVMGIEL